MLVHTYVEFTDSVLIVRLVKLNSYICTIRMYMYIYSLITAQNNITKHG